MCFSSRLLCSSSLFSSTSSPSIFLMGWDFSRKFKWLPVSSSCWLYVASVYLPCLPQASKHSLTSLESCPSPVIVPASNRKLLMTLTSVARADTLLSPSGRKQTLSDHTNQLQHGRKQLCLSSLEGLSMSLQIHCQVICSHRPREFRDSDSLCFYCNADSGMWNKSHLIVIGEYC